MPVARWCMDLCMETLAPRPPHSFFGDFMTVAITVGGGGRWAPLCYLSAKTPKEYFIKGCFTVTVNLQ